MKIVDRCLGRSKTRGISDRATHHAGHDCDLVIGNKIKTDCYDHAEHYYCRGQDITGEGILSVQEINLQANQYRIE
jgi:hypothetical protein